MAGWPKTSSTPTTPPANGEAVLTTFVEEFAIPTRAAALTLQERGDRIQAVLAAFDVDAQRVGSVAFQYGPDGAGVDPEESEFVSVLIHLLNARFPHPKPHLLENPSA